MIFSQTLEFQGRHAEALAVIGDALRLSESAPADRHMMLVRASALNGSAWNSVQLGDLSEARAFCLKAIELCQAIGYSPGEAGTWDTLGVVLQRLGVARRGGALLPARRHARPGDGQPLRPRDGRSRTWARPTRPPGTCAAPGRHGTSRWLILRALHHPAAGTVRGQLAGLRAGGRRFLGRKRQPDAGAA